MLERAEREQLRPDGVRTLLAVAGQLIAHADATYSTRVSWDRIAARVMTNRGRPAHRRTVGRLIALLRSWGLLGVVATGRRGCFAPGGHLSRRYVSAVPMANAAGDPVNEVAVYVLTEPLTPREKAESEADTVAAIAGRSSAVDENDTPTRQGLVSPPARERAGECHTQSEPLRGPHRLGAAQARPVEYVLTKRPGSWWDRNATTDGQEAALRASHELRVRLPVLRRISSKHVRSILRPFFEAGWTVSDVMIAIDVKPGDGRWHHDGDAGVGNVGAWLKHRLQPWTSAGAPRRSPSQRVAQQTAELRARRRAEAERFSTVRPSTAEGREKFLAPLRAAGILRPRRV